MSHEKIEAGSSWTKSLSVRRKECGRRGEMHLDSPGRYPWVGDEVPG